jgi:spermidine/putrescine transport system substrate-binding protein
MRFDIGRLRVLVLALAAFAMALALAACGDDKVGGGNEGEIQTVKPGKVAGELTISNWPGYIDPGAQGTVAEFEQKTGVKVKYIEDVNDNVQFFGKLQPQLEQGSSGGRSAFVVTDWMATQMHDLGFLQEFEIADLPNVDAHLLSSLREAAVDPGRHFSIPWQSGMTGIWVDTSQAPEIHSVEDLFDPKYRGKVTMLTEMRDTVGLLLKSQGIDPAEATTQDWLDQIERLREAVSSGQIRRFTGNEYTEDLTSRNVVASIGWSGDASLIANEDAEWRMPTEGCILWSDNFVIPIGAPNPEAALAWIDFVYDPKVQADIAAYVNYVTPVSGVQEILRQRDPELAENQLIFPSAEFTKNCSTQTDPPGGAEGVQQVTEAFQDVITG